MIKKFQQGGQADQAIMQFVQGIAQELQADPQQVVQAAQQNPEALKAAVQVFQETQDIKQAAQTFAQAVQQKTQAAKHGAKLNYIKSLKHQCAEDEEVYYFKKGGSVGCGCRKKEDGGEVTKASKGCSAVAKFKAIKKAQEGTKNYTKDQIAGRTPVKTVNGVNYYLNGNGQVVKDPKGKGSAKPGDKNWKGNRLDPKTTKTLPGGKYPVYWTSQDRMTWEREFGEEANGPEVQKKACGSKLKKHQTGGFFYLPPTQKGNYQPVAMSPNVSYPQNIKIEPVTKEPYVVKPQKTFLNKAKNLYNELKKRAAEQNNKRQELSKQILNSYGIGKYDPFETQRNKVY